MIRQGPVKQGVTDQEWFVTDRESQIVYPLTASTVEEWFNRASICCKFKDGLVIEFRVTNIDGVEYAYI